MARKERQDVATAENPRTLNFWSRAASFVLPPSSNHPIKLRGMVTNVGEEKRQFHKWRGDYRISPPLHPKVCSQQRAHAEGRGTVSGRAPLSQRAERGQGRKKPQGGRAGKVKKAS